MGHIYEKYFDTEECPYCNNKELKAIVTSERVIMKNGEEYWEDELLYDECEDVKVFCCKCNKEIV